MGNENETDDVAAVETTTAEAPSIRESLQAAFDKGSKPDAVADDVSTPETEEQKAERARDEAGRFAKAKAEKEAKSTKGPKVEVKPTLGKVAPNEPPAPSVTEMKAPQSLRGPAREHWAATPEPVKLEMLRREKEVAQVLSQTAEDRKFAASVRQTVSPFEAQIRAEGGEPVKVIGNLLNTAQALRTAPPAHKAMLVAGIIRDFGVPLDGLVAALQGQPVPQGQAQQQAAPVDANTIAAQVIKQLTQGREEQLVAQAAEEADGFLSDKATHGPDGTDYAEQIREDMADLIDRATRRGFAITLEQAYTQAAAQHPEVSKVQRPAVTAPAKAPVVSTQRARQASSSVRSSPTAAPSLTAKPTDLRGTIQAAMESLSRG